MRLLITIENFPGECPATLPENKEVGAPEKFLGYYSLRAKTEIYGDISFSSDGQFLIISPKNGPKYTFPITRISDTDLTWKIVDR